MKKQKICLIRNDGEIFVLNNINVGESFSWWFKMIGFVGYFEVVTETRIISKKPDVRNIIFWSDVVMPLCDVINNKNIFIQATHRDIRESEAKKCYVLDNTAYPIPGNIEPVLEIPQFKVKGTKSEQVLKTV